MRFLPRLLRKAIRIGTLTVTFPDGGSETFGGAEPGPDVAIRITDPGFERRIFLNPELYAAEAYMDGGLVVETEGGAWALLEIFFINKRDFDKSPNQIFWNSLSRRLKRFHQNNPLRRAAANVKHHYDIGDPLYRLFLDRDMQYSCGYFPNGDETLEEAQTAKKRHIAAKMGLAPGQRVLDIGCGWGGMALYLAQAGGGMVEGVTLSERQAETARTRAARLGLEDRVKIHLRDYRSVTQTYDRVVSVGMLEHVGAPHLMDYFLNVRDRLAPDGVALIHTISTKAPPGVTGPFLRKYIFPGGYAPSMSEIALAVERSGLWILDAEVWRVHYAETLRHWRERFMARRAEAVAMYDERFARMWEFYLAACEGAFRYGASNVVQLQLARKRDAMPLSRDYIGPEEARLKALEPGFLEATLESAAHASFEPPLKGGSSG